MHIALIVRRLNGKGGVQRQALSLVKPFERAGHRVTLYTFNYDKENCYPELVGDTKVVELEKSRRLSTGGSLGILNETRMAYRLAKLIEPTTDILHPHDTVAHHVAYFYKKLVKNIPSVWNMNELAAMRWPPELLSIVEDPAFHDVPARSLFLKRLSVYIKNAYDTFFVWGQDVVTVFDTFHQKLLKRFSARDAIIVPSGLDTDRFIYTPKEPPRKGEKLLLLSSGVFLSYRRFEDIIRALPALIAQGYDPHLTILGDTSTDKKYLVALTKLVIELSLDERVIFFGTYLDSELVDLFKKSHIFIFPHFQSQGLSVYESIASGVPTIIARVPGTYETLVDGEHALFVPMRSSESIGTAIRRLVDDPRQYKALSEMGSKKTRSAFSWEGYAQNMLRVIETQLLPRNRNV